MQQDYEETIKKGSSGQKPDNGKGAAARTNDSDASGGNVASVSGSSAKPEKIFDRWIKSSEGKKKILNENYQKVGVGVAKGKPKKGGQEKVV